MNPSLADLASGAQAGLRRGTLRGGELRATLLAVPAGDREAFVDTLLAVPEEPPDQPVLPRGSVPYLPAGVDEILAMVAEVPLRRQDRFVDLGSGLGRVVLLAHLLSGAAAHGIEIQAPLVEKAQSCAQTLGLLPVSFQCADAATADLDGTVFFLYSPFTGMTLRRVLDRLAGLPPGRSLTIAAVGLELPGETWLRPRSTSLPALTIYDRI